MKHIRAALVLTGITLNLLFWIIPLLVTVLLQTVVRSDDFRHLCFRATDRIYRAAVRLDSFLLRRVLGIDFIIHGAVPNDTSEQCIVVSNHRSWFDILVIQEVISGRGPILKFLIKRELIYVPIVGWICLALDFPRLHRSRDAVGREKDFASVAAAAAKVNETPCALMNFAEGTRFSRIKRDRLASPYQHLLKPKTGGFRIMLGALSADIVDITLVYPIDDITFWRCLSGELKTVEIFVDRYPHSAVNEPGEWLDARWKEKESRIANSNIRAARSV